MKKPQEIVTPDQIIEPVLRRRWFLILPVVLSLVAGIYLAITLPKTYQASTLILIQPQKVPDEFVRSIVSSDIDSRINTISQQIMSRSNLEKVIADFNLFAEPDQADMFMEDKIEQLRRRISVDLIREDRRRPADAFSISFKGKNPERVMRVTNALASYFIDENLKVREAQALGTSDFLEDELNDIRSQLEVQEAALKNYRARYMGGLPEQLQTNLRILEGLQLQLNMKNESMRYAKNNLILLENQLKQERRDATADDSDERPATAPAVKSPDAERLEAMRNALAQLSLSYTDQHPDVVRLKASIAELEDKIARTDPGPDEPAPRRAAPNADRQRRLDARLARLEERDELKLQIATLESEIEKIEQQIRFYQKMVEETPKREQELLSLNRDYQNIKEIYDSILARKLESDIAVNMEKKQKGEQFRILDAARVPMKPSEPDMRKLFVMVVGAGAGLGAGLIFLLEYLDTSFRKPEELEAYLAVPILCLVPKLLHKRDRRLKMVNNTLSVLFVGVSLLLLAGFGALTLYGTEKTLDFVSRVIRM